MRSAQTEEQTKILEAVCRWIEAAAAAGVDVFQGGPTQFRANMWHSSLLARLLQGKEPLPEPPPLAYSYPNYSLAEGEECVVGCAAVWTVASLKKAEELEAKSSTLTIDQSVWEVVEQPNPDEAIVRWPGQSALYALRRRAGGTPGISDYTLVRLPAGQG